MKNLFDWLGQHLFVKNLILVVCSIIVLVFAAHLLLGVFTQHNRHHTVPDLAGMTMSEAVRAGRGGNLRLEINDSVYRNDMPPRVVLFQRPAAGEQVKSGRRILVTVNASQPMMVRIPFVTGVSLRQAKSDLATAGFEIEEIIYKPDLATDYVLETRYGGKAITRDKATEAPQGSGITLVVGRNESNR